MVINEQLQQFKISPVAYTGQNKNDLGLSGYANPVKILKDWGYELIHQNNPLYCCKTIKI